MTVGELIELLQGFEPEDKIGFAYPAGDYWRTTIVKSVTEASEDSVKYSDYHQENVIVDDLNESTDLMIVLR